MYCTEQEEIEGEEKCTHLKSFQLFPQNYPVQKPNKKVNFKSQI